jgi:hypothetical protein
MSNPKKPKPGDLHIDLRAHTFVYVTPEFLKECNKLRKGADKAIRTVLCADAKARKRAGVSAEVVEELEQLWSEFQELGEAEPAVARLHQLVRETRLQRAHEIATRLAEISAQVRRREKRAHGGGLIAGPFEDLLDYQSAPAHKAAATRKKAKSKKPADEG